MLLNDNTNPRHYVTWCKAPVDALVTTASFADPNCHALQNDHRRSVGARVSLSFLHKIEDVLLSAQIWLCCEDVIHIYMYIRYYIIFIYIYIIFLLYQRVWKYIHDINNDMWIFYTIYRDYPPCPLTFPTHPFLIVELHESLVVVGRISQVWTIDGREWTHY